MTSCHCVVRADIVATKLNLGNFGWNFFLLIQCAVVQNTFYVYPIFALFLYTFWTLSIEVHTSCLVERISITKNRPERVQSARKLTSIKLININLLNLVILVSRCLRVDWFTSLGRHDYNYNSNTRNNLKQALIQVIDKNSQPQTENWDANFADGEGECEGERQMMLRVHLIPRGSKEMFVLTQMCVPSLYNPGIPLHLNILCLSKPRIPHGTCALIPPWQTHTTLHIHISQPHHVEHCQFVIEPKFTNIIIRPMIHFLRLSHLCCIHHYCPPTMPHPDGAYPKLPKPLFPSPRAYSACLWSSIFHMHDPCRPAAVQPTLGHYTSHPPPWGRWVPGACMTVFHAAGRWVVVANSKNAGSRWEWVGENSCVGWSEGWIRCFFLNGKNIGIVIYFIVDCWIEKRDNNIIYMTSWIYLNQYRLVICFAHIVWT